MPSSTDNTYLASTPLPELLERGAECTIRQPMVLNGAVVSPTSKSKVWVYDATGEAVVEDQAVELVDDVATYTFTPSADWQLGEGWQVVWALVMPDTKTHTVRNEAMLVRRRLYCPVADGDLTRVFTGLDSSGSDPITVRSNYQSVLDEAWTQVQLRLIAAARRPWLVLSPYALREVVWHLALALVYEDLATRANDIHSSAADRHRVSYERAWGRVQLTYDEDDDGRQDTTAKRAAVHGTYWAM